MLPLSKLRASLLAAAILTTPLLAEAKRLDTRLEALLPQVAAGETLEVIVSFHGDGPITATQLAKLNALGLKGVSMRGLPIVGTVATPAQIRSLLAMSEVRSVWHNAPLQYENKEATQSTGVDRLRTDNSLRNGLGLPFTGKGVGVVVNDSGIDGTHPDLQHLAQNVAAQGNLYANNAMLPVTYVEGVANTDLGAGHGTHCAGTIGGTGAASNGDYEGVAPGASLIGYGSGASIFVLDHLGGFDYALTHQAQYNIRVISNSFGDAADVGTEFDPDDPTSIATKKLADRGIVVVFSAGNSGPTSGTITGNFKKAPWVLTVAAADTQGRRAKFSSGGMADRGGTVMVDGETYTWEDRPTVASPGVDVVSTRASLGTTDKLEAQKDVELLDPALAPYYTHMSGTSMAAPHVAGIVALMLEANPKLDWREVKQILQHSASNMPGAEQWQVGAGYVNAYAAVREAMGRGNFGATVNTARSFNANAQVVPSRNDTYPIDYNPVGTTTTQQFEVGADVTLVTARALVYENPLSIVLTDPKGNSYITSIALPLLKENIAVSAPGMAGTWTVTIRGVFKLAGNDIDPTKATNGAGLPATIDVHVEQLRTAGFNGLNDIASHPGRGFIEFAVANRLADSLPDGRFYPDRNLTRGEMAEYLTMGAGVRQYLPTGAASSYSDISAASPLSPYVEAVAAKGSALRDLTQDQPGVMGAVNGAFRPSDSVTRVSLAYSLVQSLGLQASAAAFTGDLTTVHGSNRIAIADAAAIPASLRGYVQLALDLGLINARFAVTQGPFDLQPTVRAYFDPGTVVTRAAYAAAASRALGVYRP